MIEGVFCECFSHCEAFLKSELWNCAVCFAESAEILHLWSGLKDLSNLLFDGNNYCSSVNSLKIFNFVLQHISDVYTIVSVQ